MSIPIIDNILVKSNLAIDNERMVATSSITMDAIEYKYDGLKVFRLDTRNTYTWNATTSTWELGEIGSGNLFGSGNTNDVVKWSNTFGLTNSAVISYPITYVDNIEKVGVGGAPSEAFQVNANYISQVFGATSMPFVVQKGSNTSIGENWYYDSSLGSDRNFNSSYGSSIITFNKGGIIFKGRTANSSPTMNTYLNVSSDASANFNGYISMTSSLQPSLTNGSLYFDSISSRWKVMESSNSRFISKTYKIYSTILTQIGFSRPTESLLETTIGNGLWSYVGLGTYNLTIVGGFSGAAPEISGFCGPTTSTSAFFGQVISNDVYQIKTVSSAGGGLYTSNLSNNCLSNTAISIKIWNNITTTTTTSTTTTTTTSLITTTTTTTTTTSTTTTTTTPAMRTIFYNFSTIGPDTYGTLMSFSIDKNGSNQVSLPTAVGDYYHYNSPIEQWDNFSANIGDTITVSTVLSYSGSGWTPLYLVVTNPGQSGSGLGDHKRLVTIEFGGSVQQGDFVTIIMVDIRNSASTMVYQFPAATSAQVNQTMGYTYASAPGIPNSSSFVPGDGRISGINIITAPYFTLSTAYVTLFNSGTGNTIGSLKTQTTTGVTGDPSTFTVLNSQNVGPISPKTCVYTFIVQPGLNYCLSAIYEQ